MNEWLGSESIALEWIPIDRPMDAREYAEDRVAQMTRLGIKVAVHTVQVGGATNYPSRLAPQSELIRGDIIGNLTENCHQAGIKFIAGWNGTVHSCGVQVKEHPEWQTRYSNGNPWVTVCYNSPYREFLFKQIEEIVANYAVDGVYFDQVPVGCFCKSCQKLFENVYGEQMPVESITRHRPKGHTLYPYPGEAEQYGLPKALCRRLQHIAKLERVSWAWNVRRILDKVRPGSVFVSNRIEQIAAAQVRDYVDAFLPEVNLGQRDDIIDLSTERALTGLYGRKPIWEVLGYSRNHNRAHAVNHFLLQAGEIVSNGFPMILLEHGVLGERLAGTRKRIEAEFARLMAIQRSCARMKPWAFAGILHSQSSWEWSVETTEPSFYGAVRFCVENHVPYRLVSEEDVCDGRTDVSVIVVPEAVVIPDAVLKGLVEYCKRGGGLLVTGRSGEMSADGVVREESELDGVLGIKRLGWRTGQRFPEFILPNVAIDSEHPTNFHYLRIADAEHAVIAGVEAAQAHFLLGYVEFDSNGAQVLADVVGFDQSLIDNPYFNRRMVRPGDPIAPLAAVNQSGGGRAVYLAAPLFDIRIRDGGDEMAAVMRQSLEWCGGGFTLDASDVPPSTKICVWGSPESGKMIVFMRCLPVELKQENIGSGGALLYPYGAPTPAGTFRLDLRGRKPSRVESLTGSVVKLTKSGQLAEIAYSAFSYYEAIELTF